MVEESKYLSVIFLLFPFITRGQFVHPGLLNSKEELLFMKEKIRNNEEPSKTDYERIPIYLHHKPQPIKVYADAPGHSDSEDVYNHYHNRLGLVAPNTRRLLIESIPHYNNFPARPEKQSQIG